MSMDGRLEGLRIASPCTADWDAMDGDERRRLCGQCGLHVHDLSAMTRPEAEDFLRGRAGAGRTCVRIWRRADGTVLTRDCPVGLRRRMRRAAGRVAAALAVVLFGASCSRGEVADPAPPGAPKAVPPASGTPTGPELGDMAVPCPAPTDPRATLGEIYIPEPGQTAPSGE